MAYIAPNSTIKVCTDVPLNPRQELTLLFPDAATQTAYYTTRTKYNLTAYTYVRQRPGELRVGRRREDLLDCNYIAFQNTSYGSKWFYAFINDVEYINNETSLIRFTMDPMQTYLFDYVLKQCYVEREHSATDDVGDNLIPESLELGEYVYDNSYRTGYLDGKALVIAATFDKFYNDAAGAEIAGLYSGLVFNIFTGSTMYFDASQFIANAGTKSSGFVSAFYYPPQMIPPAGTGQEDPVYKSIAIPRLNTGAIYGFTPKNKKLYTFPYNFLYVTNLQGNSANYRYEFFRQSAGSNNANFVLTGDFSPNPSFWLYPQAYKSPLPGITDPYGGNLDEGISIGGWGQIPFATDTYKAWAAQHGTALITNALSSSLSGLISGGPAGAAASFVGSAGPGVIQETVQKSVQEFSPTRAMPNQAHGAFSPMSQLAIGVLDFWFYQKHITPEFAHIIDDYFTRFGYACHRVKVPNRTARPKFNYIKTVGCEIEPDPTAGYGLPADDMAEIERIYDAGVTFWRDTAVVGDYTVNNDPT